MTTTMGPGIRTDPSEPVGHLTRRTRHPQDRILWEHQIHPRGGRVYNKRAKHVRVTEQDWERFQITGDSRLCGRAPGPPALAQTPRGRACRKTEVLGSHSCVSQGRGSAGQSVLGDPGRSGRLVRGRRGQWA